MTESDNAERGSLNSLQIEGSSLSIPGGQKIFPKELDESSPLLFKAAIYLNHIVPNNKHRNFPTGTKFRAVVMDLNPLVLKVGQCKSIIFPLSRADLKNLSEPSLSVDAMYGDQPIASGFIEIGDQIDSILSSFEKTLKFPMSDCRQHEVLLFSGNPLIAEATITFELLCMGEIKVDEIPGDSLPIPWNVDPQEDINEYDEFSAEINGHALKVKVLKKKKPKKDENPYNCSCDNPSDKRSSGPVVGKDGNKILFEMPSNREMCNKGKPNKLQYNVRSCPEGDAHGHGNENLKIREGNIADPEKNDDGCFIIRLGKKGEGENDKGSLELEMKAPRPVTAEDFKKPSRDVAVQTTVSGGPKKAGKKQKKKK